VIVRSRAAALPFPHPERSDLVALSVAADSRLAPIPAGERPSFSGLQPARVPFLDGAALVSFTAEKRRPPANELQPPPDAARDPGEP